MSLVPTLATLVQQADALYESGRIPRARRAYEDLVQRAQERVDRGTEGIARAMLARCLLRSRDLEAAREQLAAAARIIDPGYLEGYARYRGALARLALEEGPPGTARRELGDYLAWAEDSGLGPPVLDAVLLSVGVLEPAERTEWLERGIARALSLSDTPSPDLARAQAVLGAALEQLGELDQALAAYQQALRWHRQLGVGRGAVVTSLAVGGLAIRSEDWPLARTVLEEAIASGERAEDCDDLIALALADLAVVYEEAGDVIEARHLLLRAMARGREQQIAELWPDRWHRLLEHARRLELE